MALSDMQLRHLRAKLDARRQNPHGQWNGPSLRRRLARYIRGEPNLRLRRLGPKDGGQQMRRTRAMASVILPPTPRRCALDRPGGDINIVREGSGTGEASGVSLGQAHEIALRVCRQMLPNGRLPLLATRLGSPFMIASSWVYASIGTSGPHQHWGCWLLPLRIGD